MADSQILPLHRSQPKHFTPETGFFFPIPNTRLYTELMEAGRVSLADDFLMTPIFANE